MSHLRSNLVRLLAVRRQARFVLLEGRAQLPEVLSDKVRGLLQRNLLLVLQYRDDVIRDMPHGLFHIEGVNVLQIC